MPILFRTFQANSTHSLIIGRSLDPLWTPKENLFVAKNISLMIDLHGTEIA